MQSVNAAFTAEEKDSTRIIQQNTRISWHKQYLLANRTFTIGVSLIGGNDIIGINPGAVGSPANYKYFDESNYVQSLAWERGYNMPQGGMTKALAEAVFDNTGGRFTPRYLGGNSEIATAILPRKPAMISAGFTVNGIPYAIPQFTGVITEQPALDLRNKNMAIKLADYVDYFQNKYLDNAVIATAVRTDTGLQTLFGLMGMNTAQYDLDTGLNIIPFMFFDAGTRFGDAIGQLVEAENGQLYQREDGVFIFENRQHHTVAPYTQIQKVINTAMVLNAAVPGQSNIVNVVEISSKVRAKQANQLVFSLSSPLLIGASTDQDLFINFDDPMLAIDTPSFLVANTQSDGSGVDVSTSVVLKSITKFSQAAKIVFTNLKTTPVYITALTIYGRPAKVTTEIYYRARDGSSATAYEEQTLSINNDFIQSESWAQTYAQMILGDWSDPTNLQILTIRAIPELQLGDLVSWQGRYWRVLDIKAMLDASNGFIQELFLIQRTIQTYFRIGISTIGGSDKISP